MSTALPQPRSRGNTSTNNNNNISSKISSSSSSSSSTRSISSSNNNRLGTFGSAVLSSSVAALFSPSQELLLTSAYLQQRKRHRTDAEWKDLLSSLAQSTTLYVGNLSFYTREEQIYELFSSAGHIVRVIMGLNANTKTPCGFCFVEFRTHREAECARYTLSGRKLDDRIIAIDFDQQFEEGRQCSIRHHTHYPCNLEGCTCYIHLLICGIARVRWSVCAE